MKLLERVTLFLLRKVTVRYGIYCYKYPNKSNHRVQKLNRRYSALRRAVLEIEGMIHEA